MSGLAIVVFALFVDRLLGEPQRWHPLVGFGAWATAFERYGYGDSRLRGALLLAGLVAPLVAATAWVTSFAWGGLLECLLLYLAIGWRSLGEHAHRVVVALRAGDLAAARSATGFLVSRDTSDLNETQVSQATVESVLENGNDAVLAPLFWFFLAGGAGVVAYRLVNTLDAMWGYRTARYRHFGWAAARLDDLLNYLPARLTALAFAVGGQTVTAWACWRQQGWRWKSPNAGPVMAAGAGALGVRLGGAASYHGSSETRPELGRGRLPTPNDIVRALKLLSRAIAFWLVGWCLFWGSAWLIKTGLS